MTTANAKGKSAVKPTARVARFHAALVGGTTVRAIGDRQEPVAIHYRQGSFDGSCAACCVAIVLSSGSLVKASALDAMARRTFGVAAAVWKALQHTFFTGVNAPELCDAVRSLSLPIRLTMRHVVDRNDVAGHRAVADFAMASLRRGALVMIAYRSLRDQHQHWMVGTGIGGLEFGRRVDYDTIFVLDPSTDALSLAVYNSVLSRVQRKGTAHPAWNLECGAGYVVPVTLISAIRFDLV